MDCSRDIYFFALNRIQFLKPQEKISLLEVFPYAGDIFSLSLSDIEGLTGRRIGREKWKPHYFISLAEKDSAIIERYHIDYVTYNQGEYPPQLREIFDPPLILFHRGKLPDYEKPAVAIVGTRQPNGAARNAAYILGMKFSLAGIGVISGLARGIDREAHEGSLEGNGQSIAVLGNGIDTVYPYTSREVGEKILERGGVIFSEYMPGVPPLRYNFPARNRIISGLSRAVIIVQAPARSGALITAEYALEQGRDLYIHTDGLNGSHTAGTKNLFDEGAPCISSAEPLLTEWGIETEKIYPKTECCNVFTDGNDKPGQRLAKILEYEIAGTLRIHNGQYIRR
jgi:DNA processing protein